MFTTNQLEGIAHGYIDGCVNDDKLLNADEFASHFAAKYTEQAKEAYCTVRALYVACTECDTLSRKWLKYCAHCGIER